ncbi:MAG: DUF1761 domain-containing protein [Melioribacter sp.]|nr:DUF1761 domain-containing protein [Melioribacter sp.]
MEPVYPINFWAIFVCGLIAAVLDFLYYSPMLLGKIWIASIEKSEEEIKKDFGNLRICIKCFFAQLIMAYVLAKFMSYLGVATPQEGIRVAFMVWIGFIATSLTITYINENKKFTQFLIDGGFHFIVLLIFGIILGAWH